MKSLYNVNVTKFKSLRLNSIDKSINYNIVRYNSNKYSEVLKPLKPIDAINKISKKRYKSLMKQHERDINEKSYNILYEVIKKRGYVIRTAYGNVTLTKITENETIIISYLACDIDQEFDEEGDEDDNLDALDQYFNVVIINNNQVHNIIDIKCIYQPEFEVFGCSFRNTVYFSNDTYEGRYPDKWSPSAKKIIDNILKERGIDKAISEFVRFHTKLEFQRLKLEFLNGFISFLKVN